MASVVTTKGITVNGDILGTHSTSIGFRFHFFLLMGQKQQLIADFVVYRREPLKMK